MTFSIAFVAGVTPTKWTRIWGQRRPETPLTVFRTEMPEQVAVLRDLRATVSLVRLPIDESGLSVIALYNEIPVVVLPKGHDLDVTGATEPVPMGDLADEHLLQDPNDVPAWRDLASEIADGSRRALPPMRDMDEVMEQVAAGVGIVVVPHSIARLYGRKDVVSRPVDGVPDTQIALAWPTDATTDLVEEFIGIVRGRSSASSRTPAPAASAPEPEPGASAAGGSGGKNARPPKPERKPKKTDKAKAAAKAKRAEIAKAKPAVKKSHDAAPGRTRPTRNPKRRLR